MNSENKEWTIWRKTFPAMVENLAAWDDPYTGVYCEHYLNSENAWERIAAYDAQRFFNNPYMSTDDKIAAIQNEVWLREYFAVNYAIEF